MADTERTFPVLGERGFSIPWSIVAPHAGQAHRNHGQTLERLAERGGLSWGELWMVLNGHEWGKIKCPPNVECAKLVLAIVNADELTDLRAQLSAAIGERDRAVTVANAASDLFRVWAAGDEPRPTQYPEWKVMSRAVADFDSALSTSRKDGTS